MATPSAKINITATDKTKNAIKSVRSNLTSLSKKVLSVKGALVSLAGIGSFGLLVKSAMATNDEFAKMSDRLGISTEKIAAFHHMAGLAGVSTASVNSSLERMEKRLGEAANGMGAAKKQLEVMNLDVKELIQLSPDQAYQKIADGVSQFGTQAEKAAAIAAIFGREGISMINMTDQGAQAFRDAEAEVTALGVAVSRVDSAKIEQANDQIFRAGQAIKGVGNRIAVELAPHISAATEMFIKSAKDSNGWKDSILGAVESVATGIAYVGNVIQGLKFAWAALKLAFTAVAEHVWNMSEFMSRPIRALLDIIPGVSEETKALFNNVEVYAKQAAENTKAVKAELDAIALEGLPADKVKEFFAEVKQQAQEAAEAVAASKANINQNVTSTIVPGAEKIEGDLERLTVYLQDVETREIESWFKRQETIDTALDNKLISEQAHRELTEELEAKHLENLVKLRENGLTDLEKFNAKSWQGQTTQVLGQLESMTAGVASSSETMFNINKAAGIANAVVSTAVGVAKTLEAYPFPLSIAMAAGQLAAGVAQVQAIKNTSYGSGGSAPSLAGSGGGGSSIVDTIPLEDAEEAAPASEVYITLEGSSYSDEDVRNLIDAVNEQISDNVSVVSV